MIKLLLVTGLSTCANRLTEIKIRNKFKGVMNPRLLLMVKGAGVLLLFF
jgi:hypothetical protein